MTDYITIREAARRLGVSRTTVYKWIAKHGFPVARIAGRPAVSVAKMERWHESRISDCVIRSIRT